jgi:hypothetical protein
MPRPNLQFKRQKTVHTIEANSFDVGETGPVTLRSVENGCPKRLDIPGCVLFAFLFHVMGHSRKYQTVQLEPAHQNKDPRF